MGSTEALKLIMEELSPRGAPGGAGLRLGSGAVGRADCFGQRPEGPSPALRLLHCREELPQC